MTKGVKICLFIVIALFAGAVISAALLYSPSESSIVEIVQDNTVLYTIDLSSEEDKTFRIESSDGGWNEVRIHNGKISVDDADCSDRTCVHMGLLRSENLPIVCLPHKLVIRFAEESKL